MIGLPGFSFSFTIHYDIAVMGVDQSPELYLYLARWLVILLSRIIILIVYWSREGHLPFRGQAVSPYTEPFGEAPPQWALHASPPPPPSLLGVNVPWNCIRNRKTLAPNAIRVAPYPVVTYLLSYALISGVLFHDFKNHRFCFKNKFIFSKNKFC